MRKCVSVFSIQRILGYKECDANLSVQNTTNIAEKDSKSILDSWILFLDKKIISDNPAIRAAGGPLLFGFIVIIIFFGIFGIWAIVAPLEGAVVVSGEVLSDSDRKIIQHLEGGIIKKIVVHSGDYVSKGQPLIYLDVNSTEITIKSVTERLLSMYARKDMLMALRDDLKKIEFSEEFTSFANKKLIKKISLMYKKLFNNHKTVFEGKKSILLNRISQLKEQLIASKSSLYIAKKQYSIAKTDIEARRKLFKDGYLSRAQIGIFESQYADAEGRFLQAKSLSFNSIEKIEELKLQFKDLSNNRIESANQDIESTETQIIELIGRRDISLDIFKRSVIRTPIDGVITNIKYHTERGVIAAGSEIMTIVPKSDNLIVESKIPINRIEEIISAQNNPKFLVTDKSGNIKGLRVRLRLTAYSSRSVGILTGIAKKVSADSIQDVSGGRYYSIRVVIPEDELKKFHGLKLYPGMPVQVMIVTNSRTLFSYLVSPIISTMDAAFKER